MKADLRRDLLTRRAALSVAGRARADAARDLGLLDLPSLVAASVVAAYVSVGNEPATDALIASLRGRGVGVLLPRLRGDGGLDLVLDDGSRTAGLRGTVEPTGPAVSVEPEVWLVPALACSRSGVRLGRGGGAYDRTLPPGALSIALLHDGELLDELPSEPHDVRVRWAALPSGVVELSGRSDP